jgi:hypothetical protein
VETMPAGVIIRRRLLSRSASYTMPELSTATPDGFQKLALAAAPSLAPTAPDPATVVTTPLGAIARMRWFPVSTTYTVPSLSTARPVGAPKLALLPAPSLKVAVPEPASVDTDGAVHVELDTNKATCWTASPHTTMGERVWVGEEKEDAAHLTQAVALHALLPEGRS